MFGHKNQNQLSTKHRHEDKRRAKLDVKTKAISQPRPPIVIGIENRKERQTDYLRHVY